MGEQAPAGSVGRTVTAGYAARDPVADIVRDTLWLAATDRRWTTSVRC
jgi:hypothetical protein